MILPIAKSFKHLLNQSLSSIRASLSALLTARNTSHDHTTNSAAKTVKTSQISPGWASKKNRSRIIERTKPAKSPKSRTSTLHRSDRFQSTKKTPQVIAASVQRLKWTTPRQATAEGQRAKDTRTKSHRNSPASCLNTGNFRRAMTHRSVLWTVSRTTNLKPGPWMVRPTQRAFSLIFRILE